MKRCPECRRDYYDETLLYCLDDGTALLDGPASGDGPAMAALSSTNSPDNVPTRAQIDTTGETAIIPTEERPRSTPDGKDRALKTKWSKRNTVITAVAV